MHGVKERALNYVVCVYIHYTYIYNIIYNKEHYSYCANIRI